MDPNISLKACWRHQGHQAGVVYYKELSFKTFIQNYIAIIFIQSKL